MKYSILLMVLIVSCGDQSSSKKAKPLDLGVSNIEKLEASIQTKYKYEFVDEFDMTSLGCNEQYLEDTINYLQQTKVYLDKVVEYKQHNTPKAQTILQHYNSTIDNLDTLVTDWPEDCKNKKVLPKVERKYRLSHKIPLNEKSSIPVIDTLMKNDVYKNISDKVRKQIKSGVTPDLRDIVSLNIFKQAILKYEREVSVTEFSYVKNTIEELANKIDPSLMKSAEQLGEVKVQYEEFIEKDLGKKILYNKAYFSAISKIKSGKTQCMGGTVTELLLNSISQGENYYNKRPVVILEPGHILPGFILSNGTSHYLFGVEMTVAGQGISSFGELKNLQRDDIIFYDAFDYLLISAFESYIKTPRETLLSLYKSFIEEYNVSNLEAESHFAKVYKKSLSRPSSLSGNIFGFGSSNTPAGTIERSYADNLNKSSDSSYKLSDIKSTLIDEISGDSSLISEIKDLINNMEYYTFPEEENIHVDSGDLTINDLYNSVVFECDNNYRLTITQFSYNQMITNGVLELFDSFNSTTPSEVLFFDSFGNHKLERKIEHDFNSHTYEIETLGCRRL